MGAAREPLTTIRLPASLRRRLRDYQIAGKTPADVLEEFMDEIPPDYFRRDLQWALLLRRESLEEFRRAHYLRSPRGRLRVRSARSGPARSS